MKKTLCALLAILLTMSLFSGCGDDPKGENNVLYNAEKAAKLGDLGGLELPLVEEPVTIEWSVTSSHENFNESWVATTLREVTGVDIQFRVVPAAVALEKLNVWLASKDLPDINGQSLEQPVANDLAAQGAIAAVEDYQDVLPNFQRLYGENGKYNWVFKSYAAPHDGKLYGYYSAGSSRDVNHGMLYRKDIFDKHNIPMWDSPEGFYDAMKQLKALYPSSTPFTSKNQDSLLNKLSTSWGVAAFNPYYDEETGKWGYSDTSAAYKNMLDYLRKLYDEGLLDKEFLTLTQAAWTSKMTQADKAFTTWDWIGRLEMFAQQATNVPGYDLRYANPIGPNQRIVQPGPAVTWPKYVSKTDNAEIAFKLLDFMSSPAGAEFITMGIEGDTYVFDENGVVKHPAYTYADADNTPDMNKLMEKYGLYTEGLYQSFDKRCAYFQLTEKETEAQHFVDDTSRIEPEDPVLAFTGDEQAKIDAIQAKLDTAGREFASKYILSNETGDAAWNAWLAKAESLGVNELVQIYNDAQQRYNAD